MKTHIWEEDRIFVIQKELNELIEDGTVNTVVSFNLTHTHRDRYSAILIYR